VSLVRSLRRFERDRRFWRLVDVDGPQRCWAWKGELDAAGEPSYGGRPARVHAYELARGPVAPATHVVRRCSHRLCVNPDHLEPVGAPGR
jgi:hypothetical protein